MNLPTLQFFVGFSSKHFRPSHPKVKRESLFVAASWVDISDKYEHISVFLGIGAVANTPRPAAGIFDFLIVIGRSSSNFLFCNIKFVSFGENIVYLQPNFLSTSFV
jgi:hypothetical protein